MTTILKSRLLILYFVQLLMSLWIYTSSFSFADLAHNMFSKLFVGSCNKTYNQGYQANVSFLMVSMS